VANLPLKSTKPNMAKIFTKELVRLVAKKEKQVGSPTQKLITQKTTHDTPLTLGQKVAGSAEEEKTMIVLILSSLAVIATALILMGEENARETNQRIKKKPSQANRNKKPLARRILSKRTDRQVRRVARTSRLSQHNKSAKKMEKRNK